ncbi:P-loop containing nucleoside triphosphate hydrolase protein [Cubamyces lactineus]|nr:P-loop containing nucleoside triphosphate hydrolase protein [Cubamyces lactineus]
MAASLWSKSAALLPAARICRCSQNALAVHALRAGRFSSVRFASAVAAEDSHDRYGGTRDRFGSRRGFEQRRKGPRAWESPKEDEEPRPSPHTDQPEFNTLDGVVSRPVLDALTGPPFRLKHMSPVQAAVLPLIPKLLEPCNPEGESTGIRDLLVKARTGTGKTLGFLVPAVEARLKKLNEHRESVRNDLGKDDKTPLARAVERFARDNVGALIISPTRELATQIANEAIKLTRQLDHFEVRLLVGGLPKSAQLREWNRGRRDIVVATPGRLRDCIENDSGFKDALRTTDVFILDEADTLLEMGFREDIQAIAEELKPSPERQTFMFSATISPAIRQIARSILAKNHEFINCVPDDAPPTHQSIPQFYTALPSAKEQLPHVLRLIAEDQLLHPKMSKVLVFLPTTSLVRLYATIIEQLAPISLPAGSGTHLRELHSKKSMGSRINTSEWFRRRDRGHTVLVTSDVSARGVDYPGVTRVIQVGIPASSDMYVHRVGRTGRGSNMSGRADLVLMPWERGFLNWQMSDIPIKELPYTQLKTEVLELAQKHDQDPAAFSDLPRSPLFARSAQRLEELETAIDAGLEGRLDEGDVRDALVSLLAFYHGNHEQLRSAKGAIVAGVHEWAAALLRKEVELRIPQEFTPRIRERKSYARSYDGSRGSRDGSSFGRRDRDGDGERSSFYGRRDRDGGEGGYRSFNRRDRDDRSFDDRSDRDSSRRFQGDAPRNRWQGRGRQSSRD